MTYQTAIFIQWIIIQPLKGEWSTDTYYNLDEPQTYYAKWEKSVTVPFHEISRKGKSIETESRLAQMSTKLLLGGMEMI